MMHEIGIDIWYPPSKTLAEYEGASFDLAVTLYVNVQVICPIVSGAKKTIHHRFSDPHLTPGNDEEILEGYRKVRDMITEWIDSIFGTNPP
jgi:arsenate reductase